MLKLYTPETMDEYMFINSGVKIDQRPFMTSSVTEAGAELILLALKPLLEKCLTMTKLFPVIEHPLQNTKFCSTVNYLLY